VIRINLTGAFLMAKATLRDDRARRRQRDPHRLAARAGRLARAPGVLRDQGRLDPAREGARRRHAAQGIRANTISPGAIETRRMLRRWKTWTSAQDDGAKHLLGRLGLPEEIARAAVYLASDASAFMTAATCSSTAVTPQSDPEASQMIVDIHAHYFPKEYNDMLLRIGGRSLRRPRDRARRDRCETDDASGIPTRLKQMDEAEVQMQILSPAASPPYAEKEAMPSRRRGSSTTATPSSPRSTRAGSPPSSRCRCPTSTPRCARWSAG